ncbi:hypothetical protein SRHO_G00283220 [Serrasalmus rhombeus]
MPLRRRECLQDVIRLCRLPLVPLSEWARRNVRKGDGADPKGECHKARGYIYMRTLGGWCFDTAGRCWNTRESTSVHFTQLTREHLPGP